MVSESPRRCAREGEVQNLARMFDGPVHTLASLQPLLPACGQQLSSYRKPALAFFVLPSHVQRHQLPIPFSSPRSSTHCQDSVLERCFQVPASSFISGLTIGFLFFLLFCLEKNASILKPLTTYMLSVMALVGWLIVCPPVLQSQSLPISFLPYALGGGTAEAVRSPHCLCGFRPVWLEMRQESERGNLLSQLTPHSHGGWLNG